MSMKRARSSRGSSGKNSQSEGAAFAFGRAPEPQPKWAEAVTGKSDDAFKPYSVATTYVRNDLVLHPKFGKGVVTLVEGNRVEVLFEEGAKKLGHGSA